MSTPNRHPGTKNRATTFLPEDFVSQKHESRANLFTLTLFALVLAATVATFFVTVQHRARIKAQAASIDELYQVETNKIEELRSLESQRAQMMEKAEITAALIEKVPRWALLAEITMRMPKNMRLENLDLVSKRIETKVDVADITKAAPKGKMKTLTEKAQKAKGKDAPVLPKIKVTPPKFEYSLKLAGVTEDNKEVADYIAQLQMVPVLDRVELIVISDFKEGDKEKQVIRRRFEISAVIKSNATTEQLSNSLQGIVARRTSELESREAGADGAPARTPDPAEFYRGEK